jgi:hypothetical protein
MPKDDRCMIVDAHDAEFRSRGWLSRHFFSSNGLIIVLITASDTRTL